MRKRDKRIFFEPTPGIRLLIHFNFMEIQEIPELQLRIDTYKSHVLYRILFFSIT